MDVSIEDIGGESVEEALKHVHLQKRPNHHQHHHRRHHISYFNTYELDFKDQRILVPGITGKQMIVINILQRDSNTGGNIYIGQCCLRFDRIWRYGGSFNLPLHFAEYNPLPEINVETKDEIPLDYSYFLEFMHVVQEYHRSSLKNTFDINSSSTQLSASERTNGFLNFTVEVKARSHALSGYAEISDCDILYKYIRICPRAKCISSNYGLQQQSLTPYREPSKLSKFSNEHIQIPLKKYWVNVVDECLYVYRAIGGQLGYVVNLNYMKIELKEIRRGVSGMLLMPLKSEKGAEKLPFITIVAISKRECADWKQTCFAAKRYSPGHELDYNLIFSDIVKASTRKLNRERKLEDILAEKQKKGQEKGKTSGEKNTQIVLPSIANLKL
jgi:hypothetical protein